MRRNWRLARLPRVIPLLSTIISEGFGFCDYKLMSGPIVLKFKQRIGKNTQQIFLSLSSKYCHSFRDIGPEFSLPEL